MNNCVRDRIPLFNAEKQQKTPVQARRRPNPALQVVDSAWIRGEFRYGAEQRKFGGLSEELDDLTDELQRNLFVRRIFLTASFAGATIPHQFDRHSMGMSGRNRSSRVELSNSPTVSLPPMLNSAWPGSRRNRVSSIARRLSLVSLVQR